MGWQVDWSGLGRGVALWNGVDQWGERRDCLQRVWRESIVLISHNLQQSPFFPEVPARTRNLNPAGTSIFPRTIGDLT